MIRLVLCDLRDHAATWIGAFAVAVACGYIGGWAASLQTTASFYLGDPSLHKSLQNTVSMVLSFSSIAAVAVLVSASGLTVSAQQRSYALWQLANVSPRRVGAVVLAQLAVVAVLGAACGTLLAAVSFVPLFPVVFGLWEPFSQVAPQVGASLMPVVWLAAACVFLLGGLNGARSAAKTSPLAILRESEPKCVGMTLPRALLFAAMAAGICWFASVMADAKPDVVMGYSLYVPILAVASLVPLAPLVCSLLLTAWTAMVPQNRWDAWYLARRVARYGLSTSTSVETPVMVCFGLIAGLFSVLKLWEDYLISQGVSSFNGLDPVQTVLLLGGPVLLCAVGAAVSVTMSSRTRTRDVSLLVASGARPKTLMAAAVCEAFIHAVTATLVGAVAVVVSNAIVAHAVGLPLLDGLAFGEGLVVSLVGFVLVLAATLVPTWSALNREAAAVLSVQE